MSRSGIIAGVENEWLRRATAVAIEQAHAVVASGTIPPMTPIGRLSETEWGWIVAAVLFGWIATRAEQATSNGVDPEKFIRSFPSDPDPWDAGAIAAILPELADSSVDFAKPLAQLSRDEMITFLADALRLIGKATAARDKGSTLATRRSPANTAREALAAADGPLIAPDELNDEILM
jgi:hypothetical protein